MIFQLALRAFYDGSGKIHDPACKFVNLAGLAATEISWPKFSSEWLRVLEANAAPRSERGLPYFHSKEAVHCYSGYSDWDSNRVSRLIGELIAVMSGCERTDLMAMSCSVSIPAYKTFSAKVARRFRSADTICIDMCLGTTLRHPGRDVKGIELNFDRRENFLPIVQKAWKHRSEDKRTLWWSSYVSKVSEVDDMRDEPGIQAADLLAWLANRYHTHGSGDIWGRWFFITFVATGHWHMYVDAEYLESAYDQEGNSMPDFEPKSVSIKAPFTPMENA